MGENLGLKRFAGDSIYTLIRQAWTLVLGIGTSVLLARGLGAEARGVYALVLLLPSLIVTFTNMGVGSATVYYVASGKHEVTESIKGNIALTFWISLVGVFVGVGLVYFGHDYLFPSVPLQLLLLSLFLIPLLLLNGSLITILQGLQDFKSYNLVGILPQTITLALIFILVWWLKLNVGGALIAYGVGQLTSVIAVLTLLTQYANLKDMFSIKPSKEYARRTLSFGSKIYLGNAVTFLNYRADMFLLNILAGPASVGLYAVSVGLTERLWMVSRSISTVLYPKIASMQDIDEKRGQLTALIARHVLWLSILMGGAIYILSEWGITLLYGEDYYESAIILRFLLPGAIILGMSRILANDIAGRGKPEINTIQSIIAFIINIIANIVLIPKMGAKGAALASSISYSCLSIMLIIVFSRYTGIHWYKLLLFTRKDIQGWKILLELVKKRIASQFSSKNKSI